AYAHYDPGGSATNGIRADGTHGCTGSSCSDTFCNTYKCDSSGDQCTTCTEPNDINCGSPGHDCLSGCCGAQQCPIGNPITQAACRSDSDCGSPSYCGPDGCCIECTQNSDCVDRPGELCTNNICHGGTPIVVDVNGDGFSLTDMKHGVDFDFYGDGKKLRIAWTAPGSDDAWLVLDRNGNGVIDSAKEMFGDITVQPPSSTPNGFLALGVFDQPANGGNGDGVIDSRDAVYSRLRLWRDANHDGVSQATELYKLADLGLESINLHYQESNWVDRYGNEFRYRSKVDDAKHSSIGRWAYDVFLVMQK